MKRLLLISLAATACGLGSNPDLTGLRISDGISPYEDLGAVQLCLGNDRIGPSGTEIGGFCVDQNKPDELVCAKDSDCQSRELCSCGLCAIKYCSSNGECPTGHTCSFGEHRCLPTCHSDTDCPGANEFCSGGQCKARCGADADCEYGEVCGSQNRCVTAICGKDTDCQATEICKIQRQPRETSEPTVFAERPDTAKPPNFTMYLEMVDGSGTLHQIWRATSHDGLVYGFEPAQPVLGMAGGTLAPSAVKLVDGSTRVYYETSAGITYADSMDGIAFGSPVLTVTGDFHSPAAVATPNGVVLYLQVGNRQGIAVVTPEGSAPQTVLTPAQASDPILFRNVTQVGSPFVLVNPGDDSGLNAPTLQVWFDAFGQESGTSIQFGNMVELPPDDSIAFASALLSDPTSLEPYPFNPVFDRIVAFLQHRAERQPAVVKVPGENLYYLYYVGFSADGSEADGIGVARNPAAEGDQ